METLGTFAKTASESVHLCWEGLIVALIWYGIWLMDTIRPENQHVPKKGSISIGNYIFQPLIFSGNIH